MFRDNRSGPYRYLHMSGIGGDAENKHMCLAKPMLRLIRQMSRVEFYCGDLRRSSNPNRRAPISGSTVHVDPRSFVSVQAGDEWLH